MTIIDIPVGGVKPMKEIKTLFNYVKAVVVLVIAFSLVTPGAALIVNNDNIDIDHQLDSSTDQGLLNKGSRADDEMVVESAWVFAGETGRIIHVNGTWSENCTGFDLAIYYDSSMLEIVDVSIIGTPFEGSFLFEWTAASTASPSYLTVGILTDIFGAWYAPIGSDIMLKIELNVNGTAVGETIMDLTNDGVGPVNTQCIFAWAAGGGAYPELFDGVLDIYDPPNEPSNPAPGDGATDVSLGTDLSWTGGDPDPGDAVTYNVYFGTDPDPPLVVAGLTDTNYDPVVISISIDASAGVGLLGSFGG